MELVFAILQLILDFLADQGLDSQEQLLALLTGAGLGGAAALHPTIWAVRNFYCGACSALAYPGKVSRDRRQRKVAAEKEKADFEKLVRTMAAKLDKQERKIEALGGSWSDEDSVELSLDDLEDVDLSDLDLD